MSCCSTPDFTKDTFEYSQALDVAAGNLARIMVQTPEYQEYLRLSRLINLDPEVRRINSDMRMLGLGYGIAGDQSIETLQAELESLPAVQAYRKVEAAFRDLVHSVDQVISTAAGVEFAPNAISSGCG